MSKGRSCFPTLQRKNSASTSSAPTEKGRMMASARKTALVVAPGRGTYGKGELGSIARLHGASFADLIANFDAQRRERSQPNVSELDAADRLSVGVHMRGAAAAPLLYTATALDYLSIDRDKYDVVAAHRHRSVHSRVGKEGDRQS